MLKLKDRVERRSAKDPVDSEHDKKFTGFFGLTNDVLQTLLKFLRVSLVPFHHCLRGDFLLLTDGIKGCTNTQVQGYEYDIQKLCLLITYYFTCEISRES